MFIVGDPIKMEGERKKFIHAILFAYFYFEKYTHNKDVLEE